MTISGTRRRGLFAAAFALAGCNLSLNGVPICDGGDGCQDGGASAGGGTTGASPTGTSGGRLTTSGGSTGASHGSGTSSAGGSTSGASTGGSASGSTAGGSTTAGGASSTGGSSSAGTGSTGTGSTGGAATTGAGASAGGSSGGSTGAASTGGGAPDGGCGVVTCAGQSAASDTCADPANCGACGNVCGSCAEGCLSGACSDLPTTGLVAYFKFDEDDGGLTYDSSPSGLVGTVNAGTWTTGYQNSAIQFDGQSTYVVVADGGSVLPSGNAPRTVAAWIYIDSGDLDSPFGTSGDILQMGFGNCQPEPGDMFGLGATPGGSGWVLTVWGGCDDFGSALDLPAQQWLFVGATFDGSSLTAYVNDQSQSPDGGVTFATTPDEPMYVGFEDLNGSPNDTGSGYFTGIIDELRIYDRALSPAEMDELYLGTRPGLPLQCGGACADGDTDPANCGGCGIACASGQACTGGRCQ
ncbi:MAG TPA: LamG-like jellyroll fold domain-containing protein [Myxococcales bacterium]|nr:LamG-like jellyroll fold domain-containing protein [Myxococcales bacterium]